MRILIADDSVANSKTLRPLFAAKGAAKKASVKRGAPAAGQVVVSCAPAKAGRTKQAARTGSRAATIDCTCAGLDLGDQPELAANILDSLGVALLNRGCLREAAPLIRQALAIRRNYFGKDHPATAASQISTARLLQELGDYGNAEQAARDALRINETVFGRDGLPVATSLNALGVVQLAQGEFDAALSSAARGLQILAARDPQKTDPNVARLMDVQGRAQTALGDLDAAFATYTALLPLDIKQLGTKNHPRYATHLSNFAAVKEARLDIAGARKDYEAAIKFYSTGLNRPCHPNLIDTYANLGSLLRDRRRPGDLANAGDLFGKALQLDRQIRGDKHVLVANDHANLGRFQYDTAREKGQTKDKSRTGGALQSFAMAVAVYERNVKDGKLPANHFFLAEARTWQGRILVEDGSAASARTAEGTLRAAVAAWPAQLGPDTAGEGIAKCCLGRSLFLQAKELDAALQLLTEGLAVVQKEVPARNPVVAQMERWFKEAGGSAGTTAC
jgi:tetratricopeptide (TPR) repeat protein